MEGRLEEAAIMSEKAVAIRREVADAAASAVDMATEDARAAEELTSTAAEDPASVAQRTSRDLGISLYTLGAIFTELQRLTPAETVLRESIEVLAAEL